MVPELVEAAVRTGDIGLAREAHLRLAQAAQPYDGDFPLGMEARCRALLSDGEAADGLYREAIERLSRTRLRPEAARARLLYGEWLRRENHRTRPRRSSKARKATSDTPQSGLEIRRVRAPGASSALTVRARDAHRALPGRRHTVQPQDRHIAKSLAHGRSCRS